MAANHRNPAGHFAKKGKRNDRLIVPLVLTISALAIHRITYGSARLQFLKIEQLLKGFIQCNTEHQG